MRIYLDTMIWIYAYENDPLFGQAARAFMVNLRAGRHTILASQFVLAELLVLPTRRNDVFTIAKYRNLFNSSTLQMASFDPAAVQAYASIRATRRVKPFDALHLATASAAQVDLFVTTDEALHSLQLPGIDRIASLRDAQV